MAPKTMTAENFMRSTTDPSTSATVIAAKVIWKATKTISGITTPRLKVSTTVEGSTPFSSALEKPPTKELRLPPSVKASE